MIKEFNSDNLKDKGFYIFGAGKIGAAAFDYLEGLGVPLGILDNDKNKWGKSYKGVMISAPETIIDNTYIIITVLDYNKVYDQLKSYGINDDRIVVALSWKIPYDDDIERKGYEALDFSPEKSRELLADDYSKKLFDFIISVRGGDVHLFSYSSLAFLEKDFSYWASMPHAGHSSCAIIDCGAFTGDSIEELTANISSEKYIYYALEPDRNAIEALYKREADFPDISFINILKGVGVREETLEFTYNTDDCATSAALNRNLPGSQKEYLDVIPLDSIDIDEEVVYIKMDIEGSEAAALRGAETLFREKNVYAAVCAYHRPSDIFMLPALLKSLDPSSSIYLRSGMHYTYYTVPDKATV